MCFTFGKDRWRQVLAEAQRIEQKHLLTIEASISRNQTDEMAAWNVQLVLPRSIHETYTLQQQNWLMSISEFTSLVLQKQSEV
ncbi:type II restriction endonuclease [Chlorobaculum sp. 24CR]|uniref:type II restriction endonuclease n=1 Tax=Chlorobaculum sp. 24CR TaxID=2508878 RepID=UPI00210F94E0|nr:type II restriction endonuclease [Chlorobaculum sp. 24CR]